MITIKFSHDYIKMPDEFNVENARSWIVGISVIEDIKMLPEMFLKYDTAYFVEDDFKEEWPPVLFYELPKGKVILITIFSGAGEEAFVWCTIRRWTPQKESYYRENIGKEIEIAIEKLAAVSKKEEG